MADIGAMVVHILGDNTGLTASLGAAQSQVAATGGKMKSLGANVAKYAILPMAAIGGVALGSAMQVDKAHEQIAIGTGATGKALEGLTESFRNVWGEVPQGAEEAGKAMADVNTRLGLTGKELETTSKSFLDFADAAGINASDAVLTVTRTMGDWGIKAGGATGLLDKLTVAAQKSGIEVGALAEHMTRYGVPLRQFGFSMDEAIGTLAGFQSAGVNTEEVMGSLKIAVTRLAKEGKGGREAWDEITGSIKGAKDMTEATSIATEYFGARAASNMAGAIREGKFDIDDWSKALENAKGATERTDEASETFAEKMTTFGHKVMLAFEPLGKPLMDILSGMLDAFEPLLGSIGKLFEAMAPTIEKLVTSLSPVFETLGKVLGKLSEPLAKVGSAFGDLFAQGVNLLMAALEPFIPIIGTVLKVALEVIVELFKMMASFLKPLIPIIKQVASVIAKDLAQILKTLAPMILQVLKAFAPLLPILAKLAVALLKAVQPILNVFLKTLAGLLKVLAPIIVFVAKVISGILNVAIKVVTGVVKGFVAVLKFFGGILKVIGAVFSAVWNGIKAAAEAIWNGIKAAWDAVMTPLINFAKAAWDAVKVMWDFVWNAIKGAINTAWEWIVSAWHTVIDPLVNIVNTVWDGIKDLWNTVWDGIKSAASTVWNAIVTAWHTVIDPLVGAVKAVWDGISDLWDRVWGGIKSAATGVWDTIVSAWHTVMDPLVEAVKTIWDGISEAWDRAWSSLVGIVKGAVNGVRTVLNKLIDGINIIPGINIPHIPEWKHGGGKIGRSDLYYLQKDEYVVRRPAANRLGTRTMNAINAGSLALAGGGSTTIHTGNIILNSVSPEYDAKQLVRELDKIARRGTQLGKTI